jgi:hypothetical protein
MKCEWITQQLLVGKSKVKKDDAISAFQHFSRQNDGQST